MNTPLSTGPAGTARQPTVALALGAGGAKGLAHIGVIEELEAQGYRIAAIAGSSMGALIGGIHATGKLGVYRDWVCSLAKFDVLRLVDWTFSGGGLIKGEKIIETLRALVGDVLIEELPLAFTAVAVDIDREREVWLSRGSLFDAIRASIAIPTVFRPHHIDGRRLVDGGLLNPLPVTPLIREQADYLMAVSVDGAAVEAAPAPPAEAETDGTPGYRQRIGTFIGRLMPHGGNGDAPREPGALELLTQAMDLMQANLARLRLSAYEPDLLIQLPRNMASPYEFYRARELIELGRLQAREALAHWPPHAATSS
ncbi:patatin-like phospholipase family protein [Rhodanobacter sp. DHB23]|uniref:patatin-like phospholipase family protein n=1 Tax=Rhodanobacter sp. DHB23 TaxID=2775923 RepID=UPI001781589C|nr:patatin-like phospholipase family protein [Rhodanobacter sp. DHB23]MBD8874515.1 patatin-like phospholipase family protein [Rhodanobacter sp. DHB23]